MLCASMALAQQAPTGPSEDVDTVINESETEPQQSFSIADRPIYHAIQDAKKDLNDKFGINFAIEDTLIYQHTSGGVDPDNAMVNTVGLFITWKLYRSEDGKDFAGFGFQGEQRGDPLDGHFTDLRDSLGTLWSPNDSTSNDYAKINQLWWGQKFADGKLGLQIGKIDPGSIINGNRFAGSGNTQYFGQPFATNPARSFPENGLGVQLRAEPTDWLYLHFLMSDSDAVSTYSPFKTVDGRWLYAGEIGLKPKIAGLGQGIYRLMVYERDREDQNEFGWALSFDQNITENWGVFLRYGDNDGGINSIKRILSMGVSSLAPFGRKNDQAGIGVSYTHPTDSALRDEYSADVFYRLQATEGFELSADTQVIVDPSASDQDVVAVFGVRARLLY
jgi:Carbohydrate-selective porin, OprB family